MLVQLIMAEGSVLCGAGVFLLRGQGEGFSGDHLAEKERDREAALPAPSPDHKSRPHLYGLGAGKKRCRSEVI